MNVVLITATPPDINAFGVRILSAVLKRAGFKTKLIFLPGGIEHLRFDSTYIYRYSETVLRDIANICQDAELIGFSFMSQYYDRACQVSDYLETQLSIPIIWGGTHPTYRPEQALEHCNGVCIGEGEEAIVKIATHIADGLDYSGVKGCWFNSDLGIRKNPAFPIIEDLDMVPFADYDLEDHYVFDWTKNRIVDLDENEMEKQFLRMGYFNNQNLVTYRTMTSRGCPHNCSYCASSAMKRLRRRSVHNIIQELSHITKKFEYIELISFFDDTFFAAPVSYFEEFRDAYKKHIRLPFHAQCSPTTISKEKLDVLIDAGLFYTEMGIQTGSRKIQKLYRRVVSDETVIKAGALINSARSGSARSGLMRPDYHIILDNPWETADDVKDTLNLLLKIPGKFELQISSLVFFPGTELNEKAIKEGLIQDEIKEICRKPFTYPKATYLNYLIFLTGLPGFPRWIIRFLARDNMVKRFHSKDSSRFYELLFNLTLKSRLIIKGLNALLRGDFKRIVNYFRLIR